MSRELCVPISVVGNESVREVFLRVKKRKKNNKLCFWCRPTEERDRGVCVLRKVSETVAKYCGKRKRIVK